MGHVFNPELADRIEKSGIVSVLVIDKPEDALLLAKALLAGGVDVMELTLRTPAALDAIKLVKENVPEMLVGAGTVLTSEQVKEAYDAGAAFAVAPGLNKSIVQEAIAMGLSFAPGIVTPSDVELAIELGCRVMKFFPAEVSGGVKYLKSIAAPYAHLGIKYLPLGGLNAQNMNSYLESPYVSALGGSWIASRDLVNNHDWDTITANAQAARISIDKVRKGK